MRVQLLRKPWESVREAYGSGTRDSRPSQNLAEMMPRYSNFKRRIADFAKNSSELKSSAKS